MAKRTKVVRIDENFYKKYESIAKEFERKYGVKLKFSDYTKLLSDINFNINVFVVNKKRKNKRENIFDIL